MQAGITRDKALEKEEETFSTNAPWNTLGDDEKARLGINDLRQYILEVHGQAISEKLPGYRREVDKQLYETQEELATLPTPTNHVVETVSMISAFSFTLKMYVEESPGPKSGATTAGSLRGFPESHPRHQAHPTVSSRKGALDGPNNSSVINLNDVMKKIDEFRGRELPNHWPNGAAQEYIKNIICKWSAPAEALFCQYCTVLEDALNGLVGDHLQQYPYLQNCVRPCVPLLASICMSSLISVTPCRRAIAANFLKELEAITRERISDLLEMEKLVQTANEGRYYAACDAYETDASTSTTTSCFSVNAAASVSSETSTSQSSTNGSSRTTTTRALQASVGFGISTDTKEKVAHARHRNSALNIIASVGAYFDVTHERFTDNIRNAIDFYFVFGLIRNQALEKALHKELGIGSEDARERCAEYLKEPPHIAERRELLMRKLERLTEAKEVFTEAGI